MQLLFQPPPLGSPEEGRVFAPVRLIIGHVTESIAAFEDNALRPQQVISKGARIEQDDMNILFPTIKEITHVNAVTVFSWRIPWIFPKIHENIL